MLTGTWEIGDIYNLWAECEESILDLEGNAGFGEEADRESVWRGGCVINRLYLTSIRGIVTPGNSLLGLLNCSNPVHLQGRYVPRPCFDVWVRDISIQKGANRNVTLETSPWLSGSKPPPEWHLLRNTHHGLHTLFGWLMMAKLFLESEKHTCIKSRISVLHDDIGGAGQAAWLGASMNCVKKFACTEEFPGGYAGTRAWKCMQA